ncbi:MAG: DUF2827 family protein [Pseudomonadota bacterium]
MRVLLVVGETASLFTSGIVQQVYYTRQSLKAAGVYTEVAAFAPPLDAYAGVDIHTWQIHPDSDLRGFDALLFISTNLKPDDPLSQPFYARLRRQGIKIASMLCGNYFYLLQEQFVLGMHAQNNLRDTLANPYIDEFWALETYRNHAGFMRALVGPRLRILPYCWSDQIMRRYCERHDRDAQNNSGRRGGLRIVVAEPNLSLHKTATVPLLIADGIMRARGVDAPPAKVMLLGGQNLRHDVLAPFLEAYRAERVETYGRLNVFDVLAELKEKDHPVLIVSHHMDNGLNFLQFETVTLGYPVVHNSRQLRDTGGYYQDFDIEGAVDRGLALLSESAADSAQRKRDESVILERFGVAADRVVQGYAEALEALTGKSI